MNNRKFLFRGFHPTQDGDTVIMIEGEKIKGEWKYWTNQGELVHGQFFQHSSDGYVHDIEIVERTIGQYVTRSMDGEFFFEGDIGKDKNGIIYFLEYSEKGGSYYWDGQFTSRTVYDLLTKVGNKWEQMVQLSAKNA